MHVQASQHAERSAVHLAKVLRTNSRRWNMRPEMLQLRAPGRKTQLHVRATVPCVLPLKRRAPVRGEMSGIIFPTGPVVRSELVEVGAVHILYRGLRRYSIQNSNLPAILQIWG